VEKGAEYRRIRDKTVNDPLCRNIMERRALQVPGKQIATALWPHTTWQRRASSSQCHPRSGDKYHFATGKLLSYRRSILDPGQATPERNSR